MVKKCIYCKCEISADAALDVCEKCGHGVWGKKMYETIVSNMNGAKLKGDLHQGLVTNPEVPKKKF